MNGSQLHAEFNATQARGRGTSRRGPRGCVVSFSARRGFSLIELMVAVAILAAIVAFAAPSFRKTVEQARADIAVANLRTIWTAERLYWLQSGAFTAEWSKLIREDPDDPEDLDLLEPSLDPDYWSGKVNKPHYWYDIQTTDEGKCFTAYAYSQDTDVLTFTIDQDGYIQNFSDNIPSTFYND